MGRRHTMQVVKRTYEELAEISLLLRPSLLTPHAFSWRLAWHAFSPLTPQETKSLKKQSAKVHMHTWRSVEHLHTHVSTKPKDSLRTQMTSLTLLNMYWMCCYRQQTSTQKQQRVARLSDLTRFPKSAGAIIPVQPRKVNEWKMTEAPPLSLTPCLPTPPP